MKMKMDLLNDWLFNKAYTPGMEQDESDTGFETVNLPHANIELPYCYFDESSYQFVSCYKKRFRAPAASDGQVAKIHFEGVMAHARVYLNGSFLGEHFGGYTPFSFEIQDKMIPDSENTLAVIVDSTERPDIPPFGGQIDYLTYGGIYREVYLRIYEPVFIDKVKIETPNVLEALKTLKLDIYLDSRLCGAAGAEIHVGVMDREGRVLGGLTHALAVPTGKSVETLTLCGLDGIKLWDVDDPNLYEIRVELRCGERIDIFTDRIGFRQCEFTPKGFKLNGRIIKLVGMNRHQAYPYVGYAMPKRAQEKDADIIKYELRCNMVRTSHYPQSTHFLNRCDEIGLLVFEEIPGWQYVGDSVWKQVALNNVKEMIERDWNHPSIVIWGVRINESQDDDALYEMTNELARRLDNTRQTGGVRYIDRSHLLEDVYTMNDFVHNGTNEGLRDPRDVTGLGRDVPYLVTEYNGHMYPTKKQDNEERQMEHVLRHLRVQNASFSNERISGAIAWCAFDYNTHKDFGSGDRICHHGVMDMFRIPKFAAGVYRSQISPLVEPVLEPVTFWARGERSIGGVLPLVVLSNCDSLTLQFGEHDIITVAKKAEAFRHLPYPPFIIDLSVIPSAKLGEWGMKWEDGILTGYVGGKPVKTVKLAKNPVPCSLLVAADDIKLCAGAKDVTRFVVKLLDQYGRIMPFIPAIAKVAVSGPARLQGPSELVLIGGSVGFWVETNGTPGKVAVTVSCADLPAQTVILDVEQLV